MNKLLLLLIAGFLVMPFAQAQVTLPAAEHERYCPQELQFLCDTIEAIQDKLSNFMNSFASFQDETNERLDVLDENVVQLDQKIENKEFVIDRSKIYEVVNTNENEFAAFCEDETDILLFGYCFGGKTGTGPIIGEELYDDFSDSDYTSSPPWSLSSGTFVVGTTGPSTGMIVCVFAPKCEAFTSVPFLGNVITMSHTIWANQDGDVFKLAITDGSGQIEQANNNGYVLRTNVNGGSSSISLYRLDNDIPILLTKATNSLSAGANYSIKAKRNEFGEWSLYLNGIEVGNPASDLTYQQFIFTHIVYDGAGNLDAGRMDDILIQSGDQNNIVSALQNVNDSNSPMGVQCLTGGTARALCLSQP